ncbi:mannonate dehydratase [Natronogracilivirga saccharolytica]|uniref:Mannonate dehydratase n=1 Tax=Natronogracilivirga saccharolytica TaxID=2812953 RepID=A0A8J7UWN9_9BACT|nr:mannonate dehydratase [Natronogracilivirga saccharolytica]MBP3193876.1 mannonate dehydratase [Natronogracilivirga saccharolytica]
MKFEKTWRWFGPNDSITLDAIRQADVSGIVTALHHLPTGAVWTIEEIKKTKDLIQRSGLHWSVVESIPVHEDIKRRTGKYKTYIDNFKASIRNMGECGIPVLCYNFMPVLDWTRTDMEHQYPAGYTTLRFDEAALAAFDLFILKRSNAESDYTDVIIQDAESYFKKLDKKGIAKLTSNILAGLPGSEAGYTLKEFQAILETYLNISSDDLRSNLRDFLNEVVPVAEEAGVRMAIHPDDPPFSLFGLPRVVSTEADAKALVENVNSPSNGLTFCTGSYGVLPENDLAGMVQRLGHRFHFLHLRNVTREKGRSFHEALHIKGDIQMEHIIYELIMEQQRRKSAGRTDIRIPFRPDHGQNIMNDMKIDSPPGYSYLGRLRGLAVIRGVEMGIRTAISLHK